MTGKFSQVIFDHLCSVIQWISVHIALNDPFNLINVMSEFKCMHTVV